MTPKQKKEARADWESKMKEHNMNWWGEPLDPSSGPAALAYPNSPGSPQAVVNQYVQDWHPTMPVSQPKDHEHRSNDSDWSANFFPAMDHRKIGNAERQRYPEAQKALDKERKTVGSYPGMG